MEQKKSLLREWKGFNLYDTGPYESTGQNMVDIYVVVDRKDRGDSIHTIYYDYTKPADLNKGIEAAKEWINNLRHCRECGCTEYNCIQCIEKTGSPCTWVEEDLCSACKKEESPEIKVVDKRASVNNDSESFKSTFFQQLANTGDVDMTIRIMKKNDKLTLNIMPGSNVSTTKPILVTATPEELDERFFMVIHPGVQEIQAMVTNIDQVKKEIQDKTEKKKVDKPPAKPEVKQPVKKKSATPNKTKKKAKKAASDKKTVKKSAKKPVEKTDTATEPVEDTTPKLAEKPLF